MSDLKTSWKEEALAEIGYTVKEEEIEQIDRIVNSLLTNRSLKDLAEFRDNNIYNFGYSGEAIAEYLISKADYNYVSL